MEEKVYEYLKGRIEDGLFVAYSNIIETEIAQELSVSRSPVRSALKRLREEGLVEIIPYKGTFVKPRMLTKEEIVNQIQVFELLFIQYIFQLETKFKELPLRQLWKLNEAIETSQDLGEKQQLANQLIHELISQQDNQYYRELLTEMFKTIIESQLLDEETSVRKRIVAFEKQMPKVLSFLQKKEYPYARKELRILFNQWSLDLIDEQEVHLSKYTEEKG